LGAKAGGWQVQGQPGLHNETLSQKNKKIKKKAQLVFRNSKKSF
jgi:hypothetical protein